MVSIKDISKETGFSVTTVSRALNDHSDVSEATKELIRKVAKKLNYVPNLHAKTLVNQSSNTIGFITNRLVEGSLIDNFAIRVFLGMFDTSKKYEVILIHYDSDFYNSKSYDSIVRERQLAGAVIQGFDEGDDFIQEVLNSNCPSVLVDIGFENKTTSFVGSDIKQAFRLGMNAIEKAGFNALTIVSGTEESFITKSWMAEISIYIEQNPNKNINVINGKYTEKGAKEAIAEELNKNNKSDMYFCLSDLMAIGVCEALREFKISIPNEARVLGYDDIVLSRYMTPQLSSISQDWERVGKVAMTQLIEMINCREVFPQLLSVELKLRESFREG